MTCRPHPRTGRRGVVAGTLVPLVLAATLPACTGDLTTGSGEFEVEAGVSEVVSTVITVEWSVDLAELDAAYVEFSPDGDTREIWTVWDDFESGGAGGPGTTFAHFNAIDYYEDEDAFYVSSLGLECLLKVDRTSGELVWTMGGGRERLRLRRRPHRLLRAQPPVPAAGRLGGRVRQRQRADLLLGRPRVQLRRRRR